LKDIFSNKKLYCILGEEFSNGRSNFEVVKTMLGAGVGIIQYREKEKSKKQKLIECKEIMELIRETNCLFIVNDDIDIALLSGADGVHIGQDDIPLFEARKLVGNNAILGVSTHSPEQAKRAIEEGADYIGVGPIFKTFTKKDVCDPVGIDYLKFIAGTYDIPHVAIGGIKESNLDLVLSAGAKCVCLVTEILGATNMDEIIKRITKKIEDGEK